jgi:hypothetical protein
MEKCKGQLIATPSVNVKEVLKKVSGVKNCENNFFYFENIH